VEFYFTSKAFLCEHIFATCSDVDLLTYLDADMYFFGDPYEIRTLMQGYSIGLTPHRFPEHLSSSARYGMFNAGFVSFRRDTSGAECLAWWRDSCFAWCHDYVDGNRFADQGYLTLIPDRFRDVLAIAHKGINCAPWNIAGYSVRREGARIMVDDQPLILYHFHSLKKKTSFLYDSNFTLYKTRLTHTVRNAIYRPYLEVIRREERRIAVRDGILEIRVHREPQSESRRFIRAMSTFAFRLLNTALSFYYRSHILFLERPGSGRASDGGASRSNP
jgi:hypothetical protein